MFAIMGVGHPLIRGSACGRGFLEGGGAENRNWQHGERKTSQFSGTSTA